MLQRSNVSTVHTRRRKTQLCTGEVAVEDGQVIRIQYKYLLDSAPPCLLSLHLLYTCCHLHWKVSPNVAEVVTSFTARKIDLQDDVHSPTLRGTGGTYLFKRKSRLRLLRGNRTLHRSFQRDASNTMLPEGSPQHILAAQ